jgi:hypothetical protein
MISKERSTLLWSIILITVSNQNNIIGVAYEKQSENSTPHHVRIHPFCE